MKLRKTTIVIGVGAATAAGLSLLKVDKPVVIGSTAVVVAGGLMIAGRDQKELSAEDFCKIGYEKVSNGDYEAAFENLDKAIAMDPKLENVYFYRGLTNVIIKNERELR